MQNKITTKQLKNSLKSKTKKQLIEDICFLASNFQDVNNHFYMLYGGKYVHKFMYEETLEIIKSEFSPPKGFPAARIDIVKRAISNFNKYCDDLELQANLHICYAAYCLEYAIDYREIHDPLDRDITNAFRNFAKTIIKIDNKDVYLKYIPLVDEIIENSQKINDELHKIIIHIIKYYKLKD